MSRTDRILAPLLAIAICALLYTFFTRPAFFDWAFERHANTLSWIARPLLVLPLCYAAWKRSLAGILASVLAILTSMFWFPAPDVPRDDVLRFLAMERELLSQGWTAQTGFGTAAILLYLTGMVTAFWRRSWRLGLVIAVAGAITKSAWSVIFSPEAGQAVIPFAAGGAIVLVTAVLWALRRRR